MTRYIDANKLHECIRTKFFHYDHSIARRFHKLVNDIPTEDVQEVKNGKWKEEIDYMTCSCCEKYACRYGDDGNAQSFRYCPYCGAKMEDDKDD